MTPRTDPFPHAARCIVRDFAKDHTWGPYRGQEALALRLGYKHRESITPWFRGLTTGKTDGQTTPDTNARKRLWAVMIEHAPGTAQAVKSLNVPLRREIEAVETMIRHGAYPDRAAAYPTDAREQRSRQAFHHAEAV